MAIAGNWKAQRDVQYVGARKWGTGINPVHSLRIGAGRNTAPDGNKNNVPPELLSEFAPEMETYGYCDEDMAVFGYGPQTGTSDRPSYGQPDDRSSVGDFPTYGQRASGVPGGTAIRARNHGADLGITSKQPIANARATDDLYKATGTVEDAVTSDPSQYEMQTSMTQRDKVRAGSQTPTGRANQFDTPIASRIPGKRIPVYSGSYRHEQMVPRSQDNVRTRPFRLRTAGTGNAANMAPNAMYQSTPLQRQPVQDAFQGQDVYSAGSESYTDEDVTY